MLRVAFITLGCKVNQYESEIMQGLFSSKGYIVVNFSEAAEVYVINTCSVTHLGEKKSRQLIRRARRTSAKAIIAITGCVAQISPDKIAADTNVDVIIGTQQRSRIVELVELARKEQRQINIVSNIMQATDFEDIPMESMPKRTRAFLKIQEGCENYCSYCIIPYTRGPLRSRPLNSVINEAQKLVAGGFKEIVLTGIHLGAYGQELTKQLTLTDVVKAILEIDNIARLRLGSLETIEISEGLINIMKNDARMCEHLHLPIQAGDNIILKKMNRKYTVEEYSRLIKNIQKTVTDVAISTDIIVGFPGETEECFQNTLEAVESMDFSRMHIFPFSSRKGTPAAQYPDQIAETEKKWRAEIMRALAEKKLQAFNQKFLGQLQQVLFEKGEAGIISGLTGNYNKVYTNESADLIGEICSVRLDHIYKDGFWGIVLK